MKVEGERVALATTGEQAPAPLAPALEARLAAPEPWSRAIRRAAKGWVIGSVTFYSLMRLLGESEITFARAAFIGSWPALITIFGRRTGSLMPATPALLLGGVALAGAAILGVTTMVTGQGRGEALGFAAIGAFLGGVLLWMGLGARRAERAVEGGASRVAPVLVSRAELAARVESLQMEQAPESRRMVTRIAVGTGVVMAALAFLSVRVFGTAASELVAIALFFGFWGALGLGLRSATRRSRDLAAKHGLICPACDQAYLGTLANMRLQKNIVEIGRCPQCAARIVTED